jgi:hypothetical protein
VKSVRAGVDEVAVVRRYALAEKHNWEGVLQLGGAEVAAEPTTWS